MVRKGSFRADGLHLVPIWLYHRLPRHEVLQEGAGLRPMGDLGQRWLHWLPVAEQPRSSGCEFSSVSP